MQAVSFFGLWEPRIPLNTDIVPIEKAGVPEKARLVTREREGVAQAGMAVKTGQRLAVDLVSPVTGTVTEAVSLPGADGTALTWISLDVESKGELEEGLPTVRDSSGETGEALAAALSALGFHTALPPAVDTVVVSCLDLDPVQTINQQVVRESADSLDDAVALAKALTGAERAVVTTTPQLRNLVTRHSGDQADVVTLAPRYPNGLPEVILKRLAAQGRGVVFGTERLFAMVTALKSGKPSQDKVLTLIASEAGVCKNLRVRIGAPISDLLAAHDIALRPNSKLILGGVMRGLPCYSADLGVTHETDSITIQDETKVIECESNPCINCGKCSAVCPMDLQVNLLCRYAEYGLFDRCRDLDVAACIECGLCAYSCTARRPLVHFLKLAKRECAAQAEVVS